MEMAYIGQQEVIAALHGTGDDDLADRLQRCMTARRNATTVMGGHIPAGRRLFLVSSGDDPWVVGGHSVLVGGGHNVEPCHHPDTFSSRLA